MKLHRFDNDISNIALPERFTFPHNYTPHSLALLAAGQIQRYISSCIELTEGKMFGLLIVEDEERNIGFLAAFSGLLNGSYHHDYFVPPIYDMLLDGGYFQREESAISALNSRIEAIVAGEEYRTLVHDMEELSAHWSGRLESYKSKIKLDKSTRKARRAAGVSPDEEAALIAESQFQKAELKRLQRQALLDKELLSLQIAPFNSQIAQLKQERSGRSAALQEWLFEQFELSNILGEEITVGELFKTTTLRTPPAGSGECAAPKLLKYAFDNRLRPVAMAEFWWGAPPASEQRREGIFYGACKGKCEPILGFMLRGIEVDPDPLKGVCEQHCQLDILFEDQYFIVVNKPAGLLSVDGKSSDVSAESIARTFYPWARAVHRLDMFTSGVLIIALNEQIYSVLQRSFASRAVTKRYVAILDGVPSNSHGVINLPLAPDPMDRPRQRVDMEHGKSAVTRYELLENDGDSSRVALYPITGRTHQLRLHCSHYMGLATPIKGDQLYGVASERLYLHAQYIRFPHPITNADVEISTPAPF